MVEILVLRVVAVVGHAGLGAVLVGAVAGLEPGEARAECSETPNRRPCFCAAFCQSPTMSRFGPILTAFHLWCFESQRSKLSWCTPMLTKYFAPAFL